MLYRYWPGDVEILPWRDPPGKLNNKDELHLVYHLHTPGRCKLYNSRQNAERSARLLNERADQILWLVKSLVVED